MYPGLLHAPIVGEYIGKITVNGNAYNGVMPAVQLTNEKVANVLTYILNSWGNNGGEITPTQVESARNKH